MNEFRQRLIREFQDREYREAYAEDFLRTSLAAQISAIREQRHLSQEQLAEVIGTKQAGVSRIENVNYSRWNIDTLRKVAFALGTRLKVSFETFGTLVEDVERFSRADLQRPAFDEDPVFKVGPSTASVPEVADDPVTAVDRFRKTLADWLADSNASLAPLIKWLHGYGLFVQQSEEPYQKILRALPVGAPRGEAVQRLAARTGDLLQMRPDVVRLEPRSDDFLYNLFLLCAGLDRPELSGPLRGVYGRLKAGECKLNKELRDALLSALIRNQDDTSLESELWNPLLETGQHDVLPGNAFAGLLGSMRMHPGDPSLAARSLKTFAAFLDNREDRRLEFRRGVNLALSPAASAGAEDDLLFAGQSGDTILPEWALESFPHLVVPVIGTNEYFIYSALLDIFPQNMYISKTSWESPVFLLVEMTNEGKQILEQDVLPVLDDRFSDAWLENDRAFYGRLSHLLATIRRLVRIADSTSHGLGIQKQCVEEFVINAKESKQKALYKALSAHA